MTRAQDQLRLMAIALIQEGIGDLNSETKSELEALAVDEKTWQEQVIEHVNGRVISVPFVLAAIAKKWEASPHKNRELFTRQILADCGLL